jgi:archaellum component FlaC
MKFIVNLLFQVAIIYLIIKKSNQIMAKQDQFNAAFQEMTDAITDIGNDIQALKDQIASQDTISQESLDQLQALADKAKALGDSNPAPAPAE